MNLTCTFISSEIVRERGLWGFLHSHEHWVFLPFAQKSGKCDTRKIQYEACLELFVTMISVTWIWFLVNPTFQLLRNRHAFSNVKRDVKVEFLSYKLRGEEEPNRAFGKNKESLPSDDELLVDNKEFLIIKIWKNKKCCKCIWRLWY
jgi:hypothetical protein